MRTENTPTPLLARFTWGQTELLVAAALAVAVLAVYSPAMKGEFLWDDNDYISQNRVLDRPDALHTIWLQPQSTPQYYPIVFTSFWAEHHLWGAWTLPYHLLNVLLHIVNALLIWRLLVRLGIPGAAIAAAIFALHPIHVESVAWITERKNVVSMLFLLLATSSYLTFATEEQAARGRKIALYVLALVLFAAALLSKTSVVFLPAGLALIVWWKTGRLGMKQLMPLVPFAALALGASLMTLWVENVTQRQVPAQPLEAFERIVVAGQAIWFYLGKLFWPHPLVPIYPRWDMSSVSTWQILAPASVAAVLAALWLLRGRLGRAPLTAGAFFVLALAPMLGLVWLAYMESSFVADHFVYVACLGVIVPIVGAAAWLVQRRPSAVRRCIGLGVAGVVLAALAVMSWQQAGHYRTLERFFRFTAVHNPGSPMAHSNLGIALMKTGQEEEALKEFSTTLKLQPNRPRVRLCMGKIYERTGRLPAAIDWYKKELELFPGDIDPLHELGISMVNAGQYDEGIEYLIRFLKVIPNVPDSQRALGMAYMAKNKYDLAIDRLAFSIHLNPSFLPAYHGLAKALAAAGRPSDAIAIYKEALRISPQDFFSQYYLAAMYVQCGLFEQAIDAYKRAITLGARPEACNDLAYLLAATPDASLRRPDMAIELSQQALRMLSGPDASILDTLAVAYASAGRFDEARKTAKDALDLAAKTQNKALGDVIAGHLRKFEANEMVIEATIAPAPAPAATSRPIVP